MAVTPNPLSAINEQVDEATAALKSLTVPAEAAASEIERAFGRAGESLAKSLARAASDGKISLGELASALIRAVGQMSGGQMSGTGSDAPGGGVGDIMSVILKNAFAKDAFGGARAEGGLVTRGQSYLVGERGPELFRPSGTGQIEPVGTGANITVNLNMNGGGVGLIRSESQIASAIARAARLGSR